MFGFFEWVSDDLSPPEDAYDPAIARPRCKICGKDAWLMWNGKYSAYCSTECQRNDRRREPGARSEDNLLPSCAAEEASTAKVFERALAAKKAAKDIKAIARKWAAQKKERVKEEVLADDEQQRRDVHDDVENVQQALSFAQRETEEAEFCKRQARLAQVAEELAKEQLRCQAEKSPSFAKPPSTNDFLDVNHLRRSSFLEAEAAALEKAFEDELRRQEDEEHRQIEREARRKVVAESNDLPQIAQVIPGNSLVLSPQVEDKAVQAHISTDEKSGTRIVDTRGSDRRRGKNEEDEVCMDSVQAPDEKAREHQGTAEEVATSEVPQEKSSRPVEQHPQSTRPPDDETIALDRTHMAANQHLRGSAPGKESGIRKPFVKSTYTEVTRSSYKDDHQESPSVAQSRQDERRLQQEMKNGAPKNRDNTTVPHHTPRANGTTHDGPVPRKIRHPEKNRLARISTKRRLSAVPKRNVASTAQQPNSSGTLRVAGTTDKFITLDDLRQLRDAAWSETAMAMEESCAWGERSQYAGTLEVHLQCAESLNPARISSGDKVYLIVRCPVAEGEWIEKRSNFVSNLRWEECMKFPVFYSKYPRGARACVQLWKQAPQRSEVDQFIGEGEIPFPLSTTRIALRVQLCWNTNLGGSTVDLDCGRLRLVVQLLTDSSEAESGFLQERALSRKLQKDREERQQSATLLQTRTASNGTQRKMSVRRHIIVHSSDSDVADAVHLSQSAPHSGRQPVVGEKTRRTVKRGTGVERAGEAKRKFTRRDSDQIHPLSTPKKEDVLACNAALREIDKITAEEGAEEKNVRVDMQEFTQKRVGTAPQGVRTAAENMSEYSSTGNGVIPIHQKAPVLSDIDPTTQERKPDGNADSPRSASADALAVSMCVSSTSKSIAEPTVPTFHSTSHEIMAPSTADVQTDTVKLYAGGVKVQECVSDRTVCFEEKPHSLVSEPRSRGTAVELIPSSAILQTGISESELQALLPVALAQMDDFARHDEVSGCVPPAASLDSCTLVQPWRNGHAKRVHCANRLCRRIISSKNMNDLFEEEEFRAWGCCSTCQAEMFHTKVSSHTENIIQISDEPGKYDEFRLDSFIPIAFPSLHVIWPSSRHLYVAQRFTHVQIQDRLRQCSMQRQLSLLLMAPLLKYFIRSDWNTYRQLALRTCVHLKIRQHPRLQLLLASTGKSILYDPVLPDFWEWESENEAAHANLVGKVLMELRKEYL